MYSDKSGNHVLLKVFIIMVTILFVAGCGGVSSAVSDAISACSGMTFAQIQQQNDITDECREAINSLLPSNQNRLLRPQTPLHYILLESTVAVMPTHLIILMVPQSQ